MEKSEEKQEKRKSRRMRVAGEENRWRGRKSEIR